MRKNPLIVESPNIVFKGWGREVQIINNNMYCGKVLCFNVDSTMSFHYHIDKHETWYVFNGSIVIKGINPDTAEEYQITAYEGSVINIPRGTIHQVRAVTNAIIFEVSTTDNNEDNYRVEKGDSQK